MHLSQFPEKIVYYNHSGENATILVVVKSIGGNKSLMYRPFWRNRLHQQLLSALQLSIISLIYRKFIPNEFDFTGVQHMVVPFDQKVNLCTLPVVLSDRPGRMLGTYTSDTQCLFDLINMPEADIFKGIAPPGNDRRRILAVQPEIMILPP